MQGFTGGFKDFQRGRHRNGGWLKSPWWTDWKKSPPQEGETAVKLVHIF